jgi:hypothetical protein
MREFVMRRWVTRHALVFAVAAVALSGQARATLLGDASVPYSAERTVTVNGKSYTGMVFHTPGRDRHEQEVQGVPQVILLDAAAKQGFLVLPGLNSYVPFAFPQVMAELGDPELRRSAVGPETVNGIRTTKYRVDHTAADGSRAQGFVWVSGQGVLMRLEGTVTRQGADHRTAIRMELAGLKPGPQNPGLFQLPPGLVRLPAPMLERLLTGKSG